MIISVCWSHENHPINMNITVNRQGIQPEQGLTLGHIYQDKLPLYSEDDGDNGGHSNCHPSAKPQRQVIIINLAISNTQHI